MNEAVAPKARRSRWKRVFAYIAIALAILMAWRVLAARSSDSGPFPLNLAASGNLPVTLADGRTAPLKSLVKAGRPTVITMWASWCEPCRREAPKIVELRRRFGPDKLNLLYLNVRESGASAAELEQYLASVGMAPGAYAVLDDEDLPRFTNDDRNPIPRTYVFDSSGEPQALIVGYKPMALDRVAGLLEA